MSALWLKALPILLSIAGLATGAWLARRLLGWPAALLGAALIAVTHGHVRFSQEAQAFSLEALLLVLAVSAAWAWIHSRRPLAAVAYVVFGGCAMYTHYVSIAVLFALALWGVIALRRDRNACLSWLGLHVWLVLVFVPQLPIQIRQFIQEDAADRGHFPSRSDWFALAHGMAGATYLIPVYLGLALIPLFDRAQRRGATLLWALAVLPLFSLRLWSLNFPRETTYVLLLFVPLVAAGALRLPGRWLRALAAVGLLAHALRGDIREATFPEPVMLMSAEQQIDRAARPDDPILHAETHSLLFFRFYDPTRDHRILWAADEAIPYFDGGLMVPAAWRIAPAEWDSLRAHDRRWWAVSLDRAQIQPVHGHDRTGVELDSTARTIPGAQVWHSPPVRLWSAPSIARGAAVP